MTDAGGADGPAPQGALALFAWLSPGFPVGAYAYSHALEWAAEAGDVTDEASLKSWLADLLLHGFGRADGILLCHAYAAGAAGDLAALAAVNARAVALAPSAELRLETSQQGRSFLDAVKAAWPRPGLDAAAAALPPDVAYPVAVGYAAVVHGVAQATVLEAFLFSVMQTLVSAALRLAPIGQTAGTRVVAGLMAPVQALAVDIPGLTLDDLGTATFRADLGSMRHETQYTRLFRS
ncbi:urease accessory protein UreF [Azorhizobium doebereinerae]|uniref:urease accessory protein UreF n=1 Tax=Azorhizobium doebereinerae TaxID=281091 RepID=UPI000422C3BC|nr:urease accessory UreF family protein [Azorhizobium doebereinerae]